MPRYDLVLEVLEGCANAAAQEAAVLGPVRIVSPTELRVADAELEAARSLRSVVSVYAAITIRARRPRELLETSVMQRVDVLGEDIRRLRPRVRYSGVRLAAAGAETPDMLRIRERIAEGMGLPIQEDGDLLVRVRRGEPAPGDRGKGGTWEVLLRITPRPLSTRSWRVVDYPGALNATIAATVMTMLEVTVEDSVLDMTCGSGTLLVEQLHDLAPRRAVGVDLSPEAIDAARRHQRSARQRGRIDWILGDVRDVPLDGGFTRVVANPPWGGLLGEHSTNEQLLEDLLSRAAELAVPEARLGILTHEISRMHSVLERTQLWDLRTEHRFFQKGHHPRLFLLDRRG